MYVADILQACSEALIKVRTLQHIEFPRVVEVLRRTFDVDSVTRYTCSSLLNTIVRDAMRVFFECFELRDICQKST